MTPKNLYRAAALLLVVFAITRVIGLVVGTSSGLALDLVLLGMEAAPFEVMGVSRTMMDLHHGHGALFVIYLLFGAALSLELAKLSKDHAGAATRIGIAHGVTLVLVAVVSLRYFFVVPTLLASLSAACTLGAALRGARG